MGQPILIDNDALLKLARYGLLDEAITLLGCTPSEARVLATAKYSLLPAKNRLRFCEDEDSAIGLEKFLENASRLDARSADPELVDALNAVQNIDTGESLLFAVGATNHETLVITGDKRSLVALHSEDSVAHVCNALVGRVVSMEVLFLGLIECKFDHIQKCVRSKPDVDKALNIAFGMTVPADIDLVREGLASYIRDLRDATGALLYTSFSS